MLGMGTGGPNVLGQRLGHPEAEMRALLRRAYDLGINLFDTAPDYVDSEVILGTPSRACPETSSW